MMCVDNLKHYSGRCDYQLRSSIELVIVVVLEQRSQSRLRFIGLRLRLACARC